MMRRLKEDEATAGKIQEAGRIERERLQRDYEARLQAEAGARAAATEGKALLEAQLAAEAKVIMGGCLLGCCGGGGGG